MEITNQDRETVNGWSFKSFRNKSRDHWSWYPVATLPATVLPAEVFYKKDIISSFAVSVILLKFIY